MESFVQALVVAFREGLEAFLVIAILLKYLNSTNNRNLKKNAWAGLLSGIAASLLIGLILREISSFIGGTDAVTELWAGIASLIAVTLITAFIIWMIQHGDSIKAHIENKAAISLSKKGIFLIAFLMVVREGVEISIFSFAGDYPLVPLLFGIALSAGLVMLVYHSIVKIRLKTIFSITMAYLILQAGFMAGYSIHDGMSALAGLGKIAENSPVFAKAFDLSGTVLNHESGAIGLPLHIAFGWYSEPEWIQLILQYSYTILLFMYWHKEKKRR